MATTKKHTELEILLHEMFLTNTGRHMLDSGGAYRRRWEQNQDKTIDHFNNKPSGHIELYYSERHGLDVCAYASTWHHLNACLELDDLCREFNNMPCEDWNGERAYGLSEDGENFLLSLGAEFEQPWNTYNWQNNFDETLQGCHLDINGDQYVLIQYHGGCDVRGGYTDAKLFKLGQWMGDYFLYSDTVYGEYFEDLEDGYDVSSCEGVVTQSTGCQAISEDMEKAIIERHNLSEENNSVTIEASASEY